ncbi:hypothetical protein D3C78_777440 [compost metagenome]
MATDAWSGLQDIDARVAVGQVDQFPDIDIQLVADDRQFIGEGDIHVAEAVFGQLAHFGGAGVGDHALAFDEDLVQAGGGGRALGGHAADHAVVLYQLAQHMAGQYALGAVGDTDVGLFAVGLREAQVRAGLGQPGGHLLGGTDWRGGFEDDQVTLLQYRGNGLAGRFDVVEVRLVVALERGRYGNQEGIGRLCLGGGAQVAFGDGGMHDHVQIGLDDVDFAAVDGIDGLLVDVDADHLLLARGEHGGGGQADVAEADDGDGLEGHGSSLWCI